MQVGVGVLLLLLGVVLVRTAWVCDDAEVTFRTVLNLHHGWGLRYNPAERVQAYTHPLWMLVLAVLFPLTGELHLTVLGLSLGCVGLAVERLARRLAEGGGRLLVALAVLVSSKAVVDYSTSGLENPLSMLLVTLLLLAARAREEDPARRLRRVGLVASLLFLNRMDLALLAAPVVLDAARPVEGRGRALRALGVAATPALLWLVFALVYYGFPFPNTAYAKLSGSVPLSLRVPRGLGYLADSATRDPVTPVALLVGLAPLVREGTGPRRALGAGVLAYLAYVVTVGGDFMAGRFLAVPAWAAVLLVATGPAPSRRAAWGLAAGVLGLGLLAHGPNLLSGRDYHRAYPAALTPPLMISDERAWYFEHRSLLAQGLRGWYLQVRWPEHRPGWTVADVREVGRVGEPGLLVGPRVHLVDRYGIVDPLLARLPVRRDRHWRPGHGVREVPEGYLDALQRGDTRLSDPEVRALYERIHRVTRGPLFTAPRWREIVALNLGVPGASPRAASPPARAGSRVRSAAPG